MVFVYVCPFGREGGSEARSGRSPYKTNTFSKGASLKLMSVENSLQCVFVFALATNSIARSHCKARTNQSKDWMDPLNTNWVHWPLSVAIEVQMQWPENKYRSNYNYKSTNTMTHQRKFEHTLAKLLARGPIIHFELSIRSPRITLFNIWISSSKYHNTTS